MELAHSLHPDLYIADGADEGLARQGQVRSNILLGEQQVRDFSIKSRRVFTVALTELNASNNRLAMFEAFLDQTGLGNEVFWLHLPVSRKHRDLYCGPQGNGSRTVFPYPLTQSSGEVITVGGEPKPSSDYTLHAAANVVSDEQASPEGGTTSEVETISSPSSTISVIYGIAKWGIACYKGVPAGSASGHGLQVKNDSTYRVPVSASTDYRVAAAILDLEAANWRTEVQFYTSGGAPTGSQVNGDNTACSASAWTWIEDTMTSPADAATALIRVARQATSDKTWYVDCLATIPDEFDRWWYPSSAPGLIKFSSAPASLARVIAAATGELVVPVRLAQSGSGWSLVEIGHAVPQSLQLIEVVE